jgi:hypothetical protein
MTCIGAENQYDSKLLHSALIVFGRSLNQRVAGMSQSFIFKLFPVSYLWFSALFGGFGLKLECAGCTPLM